jgi:co-chaperonin GroES (HSP10)
VIEGIRPKSGKVLIRFVKREKIGSIIVPKTAIERESDRVVGLVVAVGKGVEDISVGDEAFLSPDHLGACIPETDREFALFKQEDVWGSRTPSVLSLPQ